MELNKKAIGLICVNISLFIVVFILFLQTPISDAFYFFIRLGALFGFTAMFIATTMSAFMLQLYKIFGKPFIKQHHIYSVHISSRLLYYVSVQHSWMSVNVKVPCKPVNDPHPSDRCQIFCPLPHVLVKKWHRFATECALDHG